MKFLQHFSVFRTALLIFPVLFLLYLARFSVGIPTNVLEVSTGIMFLWWLVGIWKWQFPHPQLTRWHLVAISLFLMAATVATIHTVLDLSMGQSVPLGIWKGWFMAPACYFLMLVSSFRGKDDLLNLIDVSIGSVAFLATVMVFQYFTGFFSEITSTYDLRLVWPYLDPWTGMGSSGNYPALFIAPFLCMGLLRWITLPAPSSERLVNHVYFGVCLFALSLCLYLTKSYGSWIAVIGTCALSSFFSFSGRKRWIWVPILTALMLVGLYLDQKNTEKFQFALDTEEEVIGSGEERLNIWKVSRDLIAQDPIWGVGVGQFQRGFERQSPETLGREVSRKEINHALHPHNAYLMFWLSTGMFGLLAFLLLLAVWLIPLPRDWRWILTAPLLYYLTHGLIDTFYWKNDLAYNFWFFGALCVIGQHLNVISGKVEHGIKIGRMLGFPTANIRLDLHLGKPHGVYVVDVSVENLRRKGLLYYGPRKTEGLPEDIVCEITLLDFSGDLYDKKVSFKIGKFLRGPMEFDSPEALKKQIEKDVMVAKNLQFS